MTGDATATVGFIGLGAMGEPMALNLTKAGTPLLVWNHSPTKSAILTKAGAMVTKDAAEVFAQCKTVIFMLADSAAMDAVLERGGRAFQDRVKGRTLINMATVAPGYSKALEANIIAESGRYVEAPVPRAGRGLQCRLQQLLAGGKAAIRTPV